MRCGTAARSDRRFQPERREFVDAPKRILQLGLARLTPTHDLNAAQVAELARRAGRGKIEVVAYQHLPVFHTEHCVFCRFLSTGTSYRDCGRPCEKHRVELKDSAAARIR